MLRRYDVSNGIGPSPSSEVLVISLVGDETIVIAHDNPVLPVALQLTPVGASRHERLIDDLADGEPTWEDAEWQ